MFAAKGQTVYFPGHSSDLLKSTALDVSELLAKATPGSQYLIQEYSQAIPQTGIIFRYDSTIEGDQTCKIVGNGVRLIFSAAEDNGLCFGIYHYLNSLGFRFYLPGTIWEVIPLLNSPFKSINTTISGHLRYNSWTISGGHNKWVMDNDSSYGWDTYFGQNGHNWAQYQRRNMMTGTYRFSGHRGDIMTASYMNTLQQNPCYVACFDHSRLINSHSVPDINNLAAKNLWASALLNDYQSYKNIIYSNKILYANQYHNFNYGHSMVGVEVPDGARWGNSNDNNTSCPTGDFNGNAYPKLSDQHFLLANYTAKNIHLELPGKRLQCYAYSDHSDTPSPAISIDDNVDVQVIAGAFQLETSMKGLLSRWYARHAHVSEYHYLNIPQWTGEAPIFSLADLKNTWQRIKNRNGDGIVVESSPAKFASLPFLYAGSQFLNDHVSVDSALNEFVNSMFPPDCALHIRNLLYYFGNKNVNAGGNFIRDNKFKLPLYVDELNQAVIAASIDHGSPLVSSRLRELKAYIHYLVLYYDFTSSPGTNLENSQKAATLCDFLAKINKLQLVNSFYLISNILRNYPLNSGIYSMYNVTNGSAYLNGSLSLITSAEIDQAFAADMDRYLTSVTGYKIQEAGQVISHMKESNLNGLDTIHVKIGYTNGYAYNNRSEFYFQAASSGSIDVKCLPVFGMTGGRINVTMESDDKPLEVLTDITISPENLRESIKILIPSAGIYKLSFVSKFKTSTEVTIITRGNIFFKQGPYYGDKVESYSQDTASFPKFFYVPAGLRKLFFSVNNACNDKNCLSSSDVEKAFKIRNGRGELVRVQSSTTDPTLFSIDVPEGNDQQFWQVTKMREYNFCFANISNIELFARVHECNNTDFNSSIVVSDGACHTRLSAIGSSDVSGWQIREGSKSITYTGSRVIDLPGILSPDANIVMASKGCLVSKKPNDTPGYLKAVSSCASAGIPQRAGQINFFPNPSTGFIHFTNSNVPVELKSLEVFDIHGKLARHFEKASSINISDLPAGVYLVSTQANQKILRFRVVKL